MWSLRQQWQQSPQWHGVRDPRPWLKLLSDHICSVVLCDVAGHGGPNAADYVRSNLFINLLEHTKFTTDIASALGEQPGDAGYLENKGDWQHKAIEHAGLWLADCLASALPRWCVVFGCVAVLTDRLHV